MKVKITTDRLPGKYPKGEIYEVEQVEGVLLSLVTQGEAEIMKAKVKKEVKKETKKTTKKK